MKWFKFYGADYLIDPKIWGLSPTERSCWITLLCYASVNDNGKITNISEHQLMTQAGIDVMKEEWRETEGVLEKLKKLKMIRIDNGGIMIINWKKRQETNLTGYERVKRYRERKRNETSDNAKITLDKIREEKIREEKITSEPSSQDIPEIIKLFESINPLKAKSWYGNTTQRASVTNLLALYGKEKLEKIIKILPQTNKMKYAPRITTPYALELKCADLEIFLKQKTSNLAII